MRPNSAPTFQTPAERSSSPSAHAATAAPPVFPGLFAARIEVAAERSGRSRRDRRWPALPEPREEPEDPAAERAALQAWERRRRLDREQQGV